MWSVSRRGDHVTDERRFDEREIAEILERATARESRVAAVPPTKATGLTLTQLQEIAVEVGIAPDRVTEAARSVASRDLVRPERTFLGAPRSVARVVAIPRALTDDEWTRLVVDLRATFGAVGTVHQQGSLRSWTNGNLQVHMEPEGDRYRVRMQTVKGNVLPIAGMGGALLFVAATAALTGLFGTPDPSSLVIGGLFGAVGLGQIAFARAALPRWAHERADQMEALAARIPLLLDDPRSQE
jgi:hypothetical protein